MIDVKNPPCEHEGCDTIVMNKYDGYCTHCFANLFPNDPRTAEILTHYEKWWSRKIDRRPAFLL
jgi:hypothetical protein